MLIVSGAYENQPKGEDAVYANNSLCKNLPSVRSKSRQAEAVDKIPNPDLYRGRFRRLRLALVFWAKGSRDVGSTEPLQRSLEKSAFFLDSDCSNKSFWWEWPNALDGDLDAKWKTFGGEPPALRVKVRGNLVMPIGT